VAHLRLQVGLVLANDIDADTCRGGLILNPRQAAGRIKRHIKPLLGRKRVRSITRGDVERFLLDVAAGKTATDEKTGPHGRAVTLRQPGLAQRGS